MKKILFAAVALVSFPGMAYADFSGPYLGAEIGASSLELDPDGDLHKLKDDSAFAYGILGGLRWELGSLVLGVEGKAGETDNKIDRTLGSVSTGREYSASGLLGYELSQRFLILATLGYARADIKAHGVFSDLDGWTDGVALHLGVEYLMTDLLSVRASLGGAAYGKKDIAGVDYDRNQGKVNLGLIYNF